MGMWPNKRKLYKIIIPIIVVVLVIGMSLFLFNEPKNRYKILQNPLVQHFTHLYHSLRKITDFVFLPYMLGESSIPKYELRIPLDNLFRMNASLPENPLGGDILGSENRVWVSADFKYGEYTERVKIRYRGDLANHWNSYKKSFAIEFPNDNLFNGIRELDLIISYDRGYFAEELGLLRYTQLGGVDRSAYYVNLNINGTEMGVYTTIEHLGKEWLEKKPISTESTLLGILRASEVSPDYNTTASVYSSEGVGFWKSWNKEPEEFLPIVEMFINVVENATDKEFVKVLPYILSMEDYYAWNITQILSGYYHAGDSNNSDNLVMLFDASKGQLRPIPKNIGMVDPNSAEPSELSRRILSQDIFKSERDRRLQEYITKEEFMRAEQELLDEFDNKIKKEFFRDQAKLYPSLTFLSQVNRFKDLIQIHIDLVPEELNRVYSTEKKYGGLDEFGSEFNGLNSLIEPLWAWATKNPNFVVSGQSIRLSRGSYVFNKDVYIPKGTKLIIDPGTVIFLAPDVSIISYSPVEARGYIEIRGTRADLPWGVFGIVGAEEESIFENVKFSGGGEATKNGIVFTGMLAIHESNSVVRNSVFENAYGDDGLNVKGGTAVIENNRFVNNVSDGMDIDFVSAESMITNNFLESNGGDSIDISHSDINVTENTIGLCGDKGISVGERSIVSIEKNTIYGCDIGIAVKDLSRVKIENSSISDARLGIAIYQKKEEFGGGFAEISSTTLSNNEKDFMTDDLSSYEIK